jgi:hypothetical protein
MLLEPGSGCRLDAELYGHEILRDIHKITSNYEDVHSSDIV